MHNWLSPTKCPFGYLKPLNNNVLHRNCDGTNQSTKTIVGLLHKLYSRGGSYTENEGDDEEVICNRVYIAYVFI